MRRSVGEKTKIEEVLLLSRERIKDEKKDERSTRGENMQSLPQPPQRPSTPRHGEGGKWACTNPTENQEPEVAERVGKGRSPLIHRKDVVIGHDTMPMMERGLRHEKPRGKQRHSGKIKRAWRYDHKGEGRPLLAKFDEKPRIHRKKLG